jgi:hypothetical protein
MSKVNLAVLKERIAERYDPDYVVDILGVSTAELLDAFEEKLLEKQEEFDEVEDAE